MISLTQIDLIQGHIYSAKKEKVLWTGEFCDRMIIRLWDTTLQYDSPAIKDGRRFPIVEIEKFLLWAKEDVTDKTPKREWRKKP